MKILLLNSNPVVNKLVVLSAQKVNDTIETFEDVNSIRLQSHYDLLIVDDSIYNDELFDELQKRVTFDKSLYICSKNSIVPSHFDSSMKKPFLPTDLVEELVQSAKNLGIAHQPNKPQEESFKDIGSLGDDNFELEEISLDGKNSSDLDIFEDMDLDSSIDDFSLEDDITTKTSNEHSQSSILDRDDLLEVQSLLDEDTIDGTTPLDSEELEIDDDFDSDFNLDELAANTKEPSITKDEEFEDLNEPLESIDEKNLDNDDFRSDFNLDELDSFEEMTDEELLKEETFEDMSLEDNEDFNIDDNLAENTDNKDSADEIALEEVIEEPSEDLGDFSIGDGLEDELTLDEAQNQYNQEENKELEDFNTDSKIEDEFAFDENDMLELDDTQSEFETNISKTLDTLSPDTLDMQVDESLLSEIDMLNSKDLKLALGEEISLEEEPFFEDEIKQSSVEESVKLPVETTNTSTTDALKKLLEALNDKDIIASLDGKKISINITIG